MPSPDQPRVAVVIPCYNDGKTVGEAVRSALDQPEPVEVVVVDDGSTDPATHQAMADLERNGVRVLRQANGGLAAARNAGIAATTARYVLPLDADDTLLPGVLGPLADLLDDRQGVSVVWGSYQRFGDETTIQRTAPTLDAWQISHQNELPSTALMRRTALEEIGGYRAMAGYEDWHVWMSLAERGAVGVGLPLVVYRYRREGQRMGHDAAGRHAEIVAELHRLHPQLIAGRRRSWRRSRAPLGLRLALPAIERAPLLSIQQRRLLAGAASHLAHGRGVRVLVRRIREQGDGTGPGGRSRQPSGT